MYLAVTDEHMMPVAQERSTLPLASAGTYDELAQAFVEHEIGFETIPAIGGVALVRLLSNGLIRLDSSVDCEYLLALPECSACAVGRSCKLASREVLGGERPWRKGRRRRKAKGVIFFRNLGSSILPKNAPLLDTRVSESSSHIQTHLILNITIACCFPHQSKHLHP